MSDINISGVPNLGIPAMGGFNQGGYFADPGAGLNNAYASQASNNRFFGQQAATPSTVSQAQLYGPQGFGGATAQAAATGAAYGRNTGGFNAVGGVTQQVAPAHGQTIADFNASHGGGSVFDTGTSPVPYLNSPPMGSFSRSPNYPGGSTSPVPAAPNFNQTFGQFVQDSGGRSRNQTALDAVNQFSGVGTGVPAELPPSAGRGGDPRDIITKALVNGGPAGWTPDFQGPSGEGSFADRFAPFMQGNPGTPSQYYTGSQYPGAQAPPRGFQTPFGADNPGGALPVGWGPHQPAGAPMMNAGGDNEPSGDTLSPRDRAIGQGSGGGFYPTPFNPGQFAPSSPFGSGGGVGGRSGGSGGLGSGTGTQMPPTQTPFFGGAASGFGAPGSTQRGGQYAGSGQYPALVGAPNDAYGNPFIQGNAPSFATGTGRMGGGVGFGGLDAFGQGTVFRGGR